MRYHLTSNRMPTIKNNNREENKRKILKITSVGKAVN